MVGSTGVPFEKVITSSSISTFQYLVRLYSSQTSFSCYTCSTATTILFCPMSQPDTTLLNLIKHTG